MAELDWIRELGAADAGEYAVDPRFANLRAWVSGTKTSGIFLNTEMPPFDRQLVRRAVALAIDPTVLDGVRPDLRAVGQVVPEALPGAPHMGARRAADVDEARRAMAAAGFPYDPATDTGGYPDEIPYETVPGSFEQFSAEIYEEQLRAIGLRIRLDLKPFQGYLATVQRRRAAPMGWASWGADFPDPSNFFDPMLVSRSIGDESENLPFFANPSLDALIASSDLLEPGAERTALFADAERIVASEAPWIPTFGTANLEVWQPRLVGYAPNPLVPLDFTRAHRGRVAVSAFARVGRRHAIAAATRVLSGSLAWRGASVLPGDPARLIVGPQAPASAAAAVRHEYGFDRPIAERYVRALRRFVHTGPHLGEHPTGDHGSCAEIFPYLHVDLGFSPLYQQPVVALLEKRAPRSIELGLLAFAVQLVVGGLLGAFAGARPGTRVDELTTGLTALLAATPTFVVGLALQYVFAVKLKWLPLDGYGTSACDHALSFVLPTLTLGLYGSALFARVVRQEVREAMAADFVRTARAKGASLPRAVVAHALRSALVPIATLALLDLGAFVGGAVVTEKLFGIPGVGEMAVNAVMNRDAALVTGTVIVSASAIVLATLLADVASVVVDPRLRRPTRD